MREGIGSIALYNIIIIFLAVTFSVLAGTMSYSKAFKVNNRIINAIEKYEGYNELSAEVIDNSLLGIGYRLSAKNSCPKRQNIDAMSDLNPSYEFCIYRFPEETKEWNGRYTTYGVVSYINLDFPVVGDLFKIPVYGRSKKVFSFDEDYVAPEIKPTQIQVSLLLNSDDSIILSHFIDNKLTFKKGESAYLPNFIDVRLLYADGYSSKLIYEDGYYIENFSTYSIGLNYFRITYRGEEPVSIDFPYYVIE